MAPLAAATAGRRRRILGWASAAVPLCIAGAGATAAITTTVISLPAAPYTFDVAFAPDGTRAYATAEGNNVVSVIDPTTRAVVATVPDPAPTLATLRGVAATDDRVLVVGSATNNVGVIDRATNAYTAFVGIPTANDGAGTPAKWIAVSPDGLRAYVLVANVGVTALDLSQQTPQVVASVTGITQATGMGLSPDGATIYVSSEGGTINIIDAATMQVSSTLAVNGKLFSVAADPRGSYLFALSANDDEVKTIDLGTGQRVAAVSVDESTEWNEIVMSPDGLRAWISARWGSSNGSVQEIDTSDPLNATVVSTSGVDRVFGLGLGRSGASVYAASNTNPASVTAFTAQVPSAPTGGAATAGVESASVTWSPPASDGGAPIVRYVVSTVEDPGRSCTAAAALPEPPPTTCRITGLTAGTSYTFTVAAWNGSGSSAASAAIGPVTPTGQGSSPADPGTQGQSQVTPTPAPVPAWAPTLTFASRTFASTQVRSVTLTTNVRVNGAGRVAQVGRSSGVATSRRAIGTRRATATRAPVACTARRTVPRAGTYRITCTLGRAARAQLTRRALRVRLATVFIATDGQRVTRISTVRLKRLPAPRLPVTG